MDGPSPHVPRGHLRANVQAAAPGAEPVLPLLGAALPAQLCHRAQHARLSDQARRVHGREHQLPALPIAPPGLQGAPGPVLPVGGPPPVAFPDPSRSAALRLRRECAPGPWRLPGAGEAEEEEGGGQVDWNLVAQHGSEHNPLRMGDVPTWVTLLSLFSWSKFSLAEGVARQKHLFPLLHCLRANMQVRLLVCL